MADRQSFDKVGEALEELGMGPVLMYLAGYSAHAASQEILSDTSSGRWFHISKTLKELALNDPNEMT